jgi:EAL domain-containing protein (putative c-di-GMP-specific phosphodiesterase class I)
MTDGATAKLTYQPIVDLHSLRVVALEAISAQPHSEGEVLDEACRQLASLYAHVPTLRMLVTVRAERFGDHLIADVRAALRRWRIVPQSLDIGVPQGIALERTGAHVALLEAIRACGTGIVVTDFGAGYLGATSARDVPLTGLRIHDTIVRQSCVSERHEAVARSAMAIGEALRVPTTASGIDGFEHFDFARYAGCAYGQGSYICDPLLATDLEEVLRADLVGADKREQRR